jgi:hypothetical protein
LTTQVVHLEVDDDITVVRARLEKAEAPRVLLVVPPGCQAFDSLLDLKLLQRYAESLALEVALVTKSGKTRVLARQLGFSVFISATRGQKARWRRPKAIPRLGRRLSWGERIFAAFVFVVALSVLMASALLIVPSAEVVLVPAGEAVNVTLQVQADPKLETIDYETAQIPARVVRTQIEGTAQIPTAGTKDAPDEPARGMVLFVNMINQTVTVPQGTVAATSAGSTIRFTTVEEVTLPETVGGTVEAEVVAIDPGPSGNVGANLINSVEGSLSLQVKVTNPVQMQGGSVKQVGMVTTADKERLKAVLLQQLQQGVHAWLSEQLREGEFLPSESVAVDHVVSEVYDKFVEEQADILTLEMQVMFSGIAIEEEDANVLIEAALQAEVRDGFVLASQGVEHQRGEITGVEDGRVSFVVRGTGSTVAQIDVSAVKEAIRGKPLEWAEDYLSQNLRLEEAPIIEVTPTWPGRVPWLGFRISVSVQEE